MQNNIVAYSRVLPKGVKHSEVSIGRVISARRRCGLGSKIVRSGIEVAKNKLNAERIFIEAQSYAREFYEKSGFKQSGNEFMEDGIPHIPMILTF